MWLLCNHFKMEDKFQRVFVQKDSPNIRRLSRIIDTMKVKNREKWNDGREVKSEKSHGAGMISIHWPWSLNRSRLQYFWDWHLRSPIVCRWSRFRSGRSSYCKLTRQRAPSSWRRRHHPRRQACVFAAVASGLAPVPDRSRCCCTPETGMLHPWLGCWARTRSLGVTLAEAAPQHTAPDPVAAYGTGLSPPGSAVVDCRLLVVATDLENTENSFNVTPSLLIWEYFK